MQKALDFRNLMLTTHPSTYHSSRHFWTTSASSSRSCVSPLHQIMTMKDHYGKNTNYSTSHQKSTHREMLHEILSAQLRSCNRGKIRKALRMTACPSFSTWLMLLLLSRKKNSLKNLLFWYKSMDFYVIFILCKAVKNHYTGYGNQTIKAEVFNEHVKIPLLRESCLILSCSVWWKQYLHLTARVM